MNFTFRAKKINTIDGDTVHLLVDLGFHVCISVRFRLARVNTPELKSGDPKALEARGFVDSKLNGTFTVTSKGQDKYGRYVAEIILDDGSNLSDMLLANNLAVPYEEK